MEDLSQKNSAFNLFYVYNLTFEGNETAAEFKLNADSLSDIGPLLQCIHSTIVLVFASSASYTRLSIFSIWTGGAGMEE